MLEIAPMFKPPVSRRSALAALVLAACTGSTIAQASFPERPITLLVPFGAGGIADVTARAVAESMSKTLGQPIVVENKPSAGSIVASQAAATAKPDGHTLLLISNANAVSVNLFKKLPYDVQKDLLPVSTLGYFDLGVFTSAKSRYSTLKQVIDAGRASPGKLSIGTIAVGSTQHLAAKLFEAEAGIDALIVPYKSSPAVLMGLLGGEIDLAVEILGPMLGQTSSGAVRALAISADKRATALPEVPTVAQAGLPNYRVASWNAIAVPAATPAPVVERLNRAIREALASPAVQAKLEKAGMRYQASTPAEAQALLGSEIKRWGEVIRRAKIELE
jgi:tripartite-type tricarboxylate transporter receptor subunit TctC